MAELTIHLPGSPPRSSVTVERVDGRHVIRVDVDDDFYSGEVVLTPEQLSTLRVLLAV